MKQWTPSQSAFDRFLMLLDDDRETAGRQYEALRARIIRFFEWRGCRFDDVLADETINRIIRKVEAGEKVTDVFSYALGVARFVSMESVKSQSKEEAFPVDIAAPDSRRDEGAELRMTCLEKCLSKLSPISRSMILQYYRGVKKGRIDDRKLEATKLGISLNALRIRVLKIRTILEECVMKCCSADYQG